MRILAYIPARGGSKGVLHKNIRPLYDKPLIAWTIEVAKHCPEITDLVVSTEDAEIAAVATAHDCRVLPRPVELASDETTGVEVALHVLQAAGGIYDLVVQLQPTSPLRISADISACIQRCGPNGAPACVSMVRATEPPSWMFTQTPTGRLNPVLRRRLKLLRRQDLPPAYLLNGAVYVARPDWLQLHRTFLGPGVHGQEMPAERSIDIDTLADFAAAEALFRQEGHSADNHNPSTHRHHAPNPSIQIAASR